MRRKSKQEKYVAIPTGVVTVPADKVRTYNSQFLKAEQYLEMKEKRSGSKKEAK